jgi:valyl-tRNA synthetase
MLPKGPYNPQETEPRILDFWLQHKFYKPEYDPKSDRVMSTEEMKNDSREPFAIICPPPNAYARPHMGNVSGYAYQDVFGRYARMHGKKALLFPGKDHAAQEAETIYLRDVLTPQGKSKSDFTREEFYAACYEYFTGIMKIAQGDEKRIGLSADFDRDLFTLDPRVAETVTSTFLKMYADGMVYKDVRIVNWSPGMQSVVADIDTARKEREADLVYIKYPLVEDPSKFISVATTRPETMLGDTAVVVDPSDERYSALVGKYVKLPLTDREIPVIANGRVDKEFGTGAVKLTPAHAADDYIMMLEWNYKKDFEHMPDNVKAAREKIGEIGYLNIIWKDLKLVGPVGKYKGMKVNAARQAVIEDLNNLGLIEKTEKITQNVVICDRTKTVIEPMMSSQWFIDVDRLKQPAIEALKAGKVNIHPDNMAKKLEFWLENLRDWPISRSIWWGYRFPVWYKGEIAEITDDNGHIKQTIGGNVIESMKDAFDNGLVKVQIDKPEGDEWVQDPDVFDTWFSSGQWPFATLKAEDLMDTFYPTDVMETGYDILELWVSRMIMLGLYTQGEVPFKDVYLHGLINAPDGQKMSKSKGNAVSIDDIISKYGADTLRLFYIVGNKAGASYRIDYQKIEGYRRFLNKIWNATKFVLMNTGELKVTEVSGLKLEDLKIETNKKLLTHITEVKQNATRLIDGLNIGIAAQELFENFWHVFCDICLEEAKPHVYTQKDKATGEIISEPDPEAKAETQKVLLYALSTYLKLLHPFIPFITEEIWQNIPGGTEEAKSLMYASLD